MNKTGIDLSYANGAFQWEKVKGKIDFAILRCGFGQDIKSQDDNQFIRNVYYCEIYHIPYAIYLYSYAMTIISAKGEINHVLRLLKNTHPFAVFIDMEDADGYKKNYGGIPSKEVNTEIVRQFCTAITNAGYKAGYYCNRDWYDNYLIPSKLSEYLFWYAHPGFISSDIKCDIMQNMFNGNCCEIQNVDLDILYTTLITGEETKMPEYLVKASSFVGLRCKELQEKLIYLGYNCGQFGADGKFGQTTYDALVKFQRDYKLAADGFAGKITFDKLSELIHKKEADKQNAQKYDKTIPTGNNIFMIGKTTYVEELSDGCRIHYDRGNYIFIGPGKIEIYWNDGKGNSGSKVLNSK